MNQKYALRQEFQITLNELNIKDEATLSTVEDRVSKKRSNRLINPHRMILKQAMEKSRQEQLTMLQTLKTLVEQKKAQKEKDNKDLLNG
jgi:hypothetical protein